MKLTVEQRFWGKIEILASGCWGWKGGLTLGYGSFFVRGGTRRAHRVSYELFKGPIPDGLTLDHLCRVRNCVNPAYLEPVTQHKNVLRGGGLAAINARKTHCPRGHPYSPENTQMEGRKRRCRICSQLLHRERWMKKKQWKPSPSVN